MTDSEHLDVLEGKPARRARSSPSDRVRYETAVMQELLDDTREAKGLSKADIARATGREPAAVRRLLTAPEFNPELRTLIELADTLGMQVVLKPKRGRPKKNSG